MRPFPVLFAVLVLTASVAGTAGLPGLALASTESDDVSSTVDVAQNRTQTNVLTLAPSDIERTNFTHPTSNVSAALSLRDTRLSRQLNAERTDAKLAELETDAEKQAYIRRALTEVEIRMSELKQEEKTAFRRHSTGELSTTELATSLARIDTAARELSQNATQLADAGERIEGFSVQTRVDIITLELRTLQGPVRNAVARAIRAEQEPMRVYASTTPEGVVLTTMTDGTYVREVYDSSHRLSEADSQITLDEVKPLMEQSYPTLMQRVDFTRSDTVRGSDIFVTEVPYRRGGLTAYIDKTEPGSVFKEEQTLVLNRTPPTEPVNTTRVGLRLTVYPSYPGGPMLIRVTDAETGDPVRADVSLISAPQSNNRPVEVGVTNETGAVWALSPDDTFTVQAIKSGTQSVVDIRIDPVDPDTVHTGEGGTGNQSAVAPPGRVDVAPSRVDVPPSRHP